MKRVIGVIMAVFMIFTSFSFAADLNATAKYLEKQKLEEWGILALYNSGVDVSKKTLGDVSKSKITTDYEAYILGGRALGKNVSSYAEKIGKIQKESGKFADNIDGTGEDLINVHIWGVISLYTANYEKYDKGKALSYLKANQNKDGGFPIFKGGTSSDIDLTCMAVVAYHILGLKVDAPEIKNAMAFVEKSLEKKESCESLAWYILGKVKLGQTIDTKYVSKLSEYKLKDGSFKHLKTLKKGNYIATYHGLLALTDYNKKVSVFTKLHDLKQK